MNVTTLTQHSALVATLYQTDAFNGFCCCCSAIILVMMHRWRFRLNDALWAQLMTFLDFSSVTLVWILELVRDILSDCSANSGLMVATVLMDLSNVFRICYVVSRYFSAHQPDDVSRFRSGAYSGNSNVNVSWIAGSQDHGQSFGMQHDDGHEVDKEKALNHTQQKLACLSQAKLYASASLLPDSGAAKRDGVPLKRALSVNSTHKSTGELDSDEDLPKQYGTLRGALENRAPPTITFSTDGGNVSGSAPAPAAAAVAAPGPEPEAPTGFSLYKRIKKWRVAVIFGMGAIELVFVVIRQAIMWTVVGGTECLSIQNSPLVLEVLDDLFTIVLLVISGYVVGKKSFSLNPRSSRYEAKKRYYATFVCASILQVLTCIYHIAALSVQMTPFLEVTALRYAKFIMVISVVNSVTKSINTTL
ncbi:uncharacterized protein BJ171DRAFT_4036 [Polychytrium aggregatum]|uniref:uncharacterized protein n=1 Tax=Polychytrium aggregatum TaxID=110093 RepID=UPI0022FDF8BF|nr:uncharacterized protein BJ171DRAFT_4036 [Polychytrium aggregatum]KAI9209610.1 hypothetical protein BJ171DRAFT_4036 [Polychytrium aggregatum]